MKAIHLFLVVPILTLVLPLNLSAEIKVIAPPDKTASGDAAGEPKEDATAAENAKPAPADEEDTEGSGDHKAKGSDTETKGGKESGKEGVSIMTAEQGEELVKKIEKLQEDQKKILDLLAKIQSDIEFLKASSRVR